MKSLLSGNEPDVQVWPSYTDVALNITLILMVYLFAQAAISSQTSAALILIQQRQQTLREEMLAALPNVLRGNMTVTEDGNLLKCSFSDRVLFDPAQADLKDGGRQVLGLVGGVLRRHLDSFAQIQVEGHTDDRPIKTSRFESNWELSSARATSVVRFLQDAAGIESKRLSATGYSEYHPADSGDSEDARARNRRIELVIVYTTRGAIQ